jgi:rhamnosyltransferase
MVSSAVNRAAWKEHPFREDLRYSEDEEWSFRIKNAGWEIRYAADSVVMHSHNYTLEQVRKRYFGEGFALGATPALAQTQIEFLPRAVLAAGRDALKDFAYCMRQRRLLEWPQAVAVRLAQRLGKRDGLKAGRRHYAGSGPVK